jgi:hypothetical protein
MRARVRVPAGLELITWRGAAFFNIVVCHVDRMRPRLAPRAVGVTHWFVAYRLQVRATSAAGPIEGLYFLRSDIDRRWSERSATPSGLLLPSRANHFNHGRRWGLDVQYPHRGRDERCQRVARREVRRP